MRRARGGVLLVEAHLEESGGLRVSHEVARRLPAAGVRARVFVLQHSTSGKPLLVPDPAVEVVHGTARPVQLRRALVPSLLRLVREARRSDVVLSGSEIGYGLLAGWLAARLARRPFAVLVQSQLQLALDEWVPARLHGVTRWVHARTDLALCVSAGLVEQLLAAGLPESRAVVVPVGVDVDAVRAAGGLPLAPPLADLVGGGPFAVAAGRLSTSKGFDVLLRAWALARERSAAVREHSLLVVGEGDDRADLEALVDELGLRGAVHLPGFSDQLQRALASASLFVLSSRYEGMGSFVLLEAMAHGTPVVATDCRSGPRELLDDGALGTLVRVDDPEALAAAVVAHAEHPEHLAATASARRERAEQFTPRRWVAEVARALAPWSPPSGLRRPPAPR